DVLPGDYNLDGVVDAADYTVWKTAFGATSSTSSLLPGDGNGDGMVDAADYTIWRNNLGALSSAQLATTPASVPEPSNLLLALVAAVGAASSWRPEHGRA